MGRRPATYIEGTMHTLTVATHDHAKCPVGDPTCPAYVAYRDTQTLQAAITERIRELNHGIRFYTEMGWDDLADEYRVRLNEIQKLQVPAMPEGEARAMAGNR